MDDDEENSANDYRSDGGNDKRNPLPDPIGTHGDNGENDCDGKNRNPISIGIRHSGQAEIGAVAPLLLVIGRAVRRAPAIHSLLGEHGVLAVNFPTVVGWFPQDAD